MATRLKSLERRLQDRARSSASFGYSQQRSAKHIGWSVRRFARGLTAADDLAAKLIARGAPEAEARRLAAEVTAIPAATARAASLTTRLPSISQISGAAKEAIIAALRFTPIGLGLEAVFAICNRLNIAIGVGLSGVAGVVEGFGAGGGIVFGPGRTVGLWGTAGVVMGEIADAQGGATLIVVAGGMSNFNGTSYTVGGLVGEGLGLSGHLMLNTSGQPIGIIAEIGLTGGLPINVIGGIWQTQSFTTTMGLARPFQAAVPATVDGPTAAREVINFFYPGRAPATISEDHMRLAAALLHTAFERQRVLNRLPAVPGSRPSPTWLISQAVQILWREMSGPSGFTEAVRASTALHWRTTFEEIENGLPPTALGLGSSQFGHGLSHASSTPVIHQRSTAFDARETAIETLDGVPVHYDRLDPPNGYGSRGVARRFECTQRLKDAIEACMADLFRNWTRGRPTIILSAGTIGDGENQHGQGLAFDLDGFWWTDSNWTADQYPANRPFYNGLNAHLFMHFPQVLSYHYRGHRDHFHVDFVGTMDFRPGSQAQAFFVQSALRYIYGIDIGNTGPESDGVDGDYGRTSRAAASRALETIGHPGKALTDAGMWAAFVADVRRRGLA